MGNRFDPLNTEAYGFIKSTSSSGGEGLGSNSSDNPFRKPPPGYMLGEKVKEASIRFSPGEIKTHCFKWKAKISLNTLMEKLQYVTNTSNYAIYPFGTAAVMALERELSIGSSDSTALTVGYQVDQVLKMKGYNRAVKTSVLMRSLY